MLYDRILIPTDGSRAVAKAIDHGVNIAGLCDASIHALYVIDERISYHGIFSNKDLDRFQELGKDATRDVAEQAERADLDARTEIREGVPYREINDYAAEADCELIVMGTHGRTGIERLVLGSTAENVVRTSDVPVMTVRMQPEELDDPEDGM